MKDKNNKKRKFRPLIVFAISIIIILLIMIINSFLHIKRLDQQFNELERNYDTLIYTVQEELDNINIKIETIKILEGQAIMDSLENLLVTIKKSREKIESRNQAVIENIEKYNELQSNFWKRFGFISNMITHVLYDEIDTLNIRVDTLNQSVATLKRANILLEQKNKYEKDSLDSINRALKSQTTELKKQKEDQYIRLTDALTFQLQEKSALYDTIKMLNDKLDQLSKIKEYRLEKVLIYFIYHENKEDEIKVYITDEGLTEYCYDYLIDKKPSINITVKLSGDLKDLKGYIKDYSGSTIGEEWSFSLQKNTYTHTVKANFKGIKSFKLILFEDEDDPIASKDFILKK